VHITLYAHVLAAHTICAHSRTLLGDRCRSRIDMFQTDTHVVVSIFAKVIDLASINLAVSDDCVSPMWNQSAEFDKWMSLLSVCTDWTTLLKTRMFTLLVIFKSGVL